MTWTRRQALASLGALAALPWARSLMAAPPVTGVAARRIVVCFAPNGMPDALWRPFSVGAGWEPSPILESLAAVRSQVRVISGLANRPALQPPNGEVHALACRSVLTCTSTVTTGVGTSMDQLAASTLGTATPFQSLQLGSERLEGCFNEDCTPYTNISWLDAQTPSGRNVSVDAVFNQLFGLTASVGHASPETLRALRRSVLDGSAADLAAFSRRAGRSDGQRLDAFADAIRTLELRLSSAEPACPDAESFDLAMTASPEDPNGGNLSQMGELAALALQCDRTRVITWMMGNGRSQRSFEFLDYPVRHHELSHNVGWSEAQVGVGRWFVDQYASLVGRLAEMRDPNGAPLLDTTLVLFVSDMGDGAKHSTDDLPVLLAGGAGGGLGEHQAFPTGTPIANLYLSMLQWAGRSDTSFGDDSTGSLFTLG